LSRLAATYARRRPLILPNLVFNVDAVLAPPLHSTLPRLLPQRPRPVNKHDLIAAVAASTNLSKVDAANAVDAILTVITKSLKKKEKVLLVGFGTFQVSRRKAVEGRNPQTGEKLKIPASNVPRFKASKALKDALN
jgi:nucleoid DNA-binding protein